MSWRDGVSSPSSLGGLTFYQHRGVRVTRQHLAVDGRRYELRAVDGMVATRQRSTPVLASAVVAAGSIGAAVVYAAVRGTIWLLVAGLTALVAVAVAAWVVMRRSERHELWLDYKGQRLCVFTTRDGLDFAKVCRALRRALESAEPNV